MNIFTQEQVFILFISIGIIIGILLDIFRSIRKIIKTSDGITLIEDIIFITLSSILIIYGIIKLNNGEVRLFLFIGISLGILIYILTISDMCVIIFSVLIKICIKISKIPLLCCKTIVTYMKRLLNKDFWTFCRIL